LAWIATATGASLTSRYWANELSRSRFAAPPVARAAIAYCLITAVYTWPLPIRLATGVVHDPYDPILNTWILWWSTKAVPLTQQWWNAPIFLPAAGTFAFSEHLLGIFPISAPLIALTGKPLLGYNVALIVTYPLSALAAYFLAFTLTRRHDAAFVAGLAYGFAPYRLAQLPHIQMLTAYWTPICLAALHRYDTGARTRWAAVAAAAWFMQAMSNGYFFFFLSFLIALWAAWFAAGRWRAAQIGRAAACFLVAALLFAPVALGYFEILTGRYGFSRGPEAIALYSADIGSLLQASEESWLWGWLRVVRKPEGELFPGLTLAALAGFALFAAKPFASLPGHSARRWLQLTLAALFAIFLAAALWRFIHGPWRLTLAGVRVLSLGRADMPLLFATAAFLGWLATVPAIAAAARRRSPLMFYALAAFVMWIFALGPDPQLFGRDGVSHGPYAWLMWLPGVDGLRVPARFWTMSLVCLSVVAAYAIFRMPARGRRVAVVIAAAGLVVDGWPGTFPVLAEPGRRQTPPGASARVDLPMTDERNTDALYQQTFDAVPSYNGYSGYAAPHQHAMHQLLHAFDPRILRAMTARGSLGVVVDHATDPTGVHRQFVLAYPGAARIEERAGWSSYLLPAVTGADALPDVSGEPLRIKALTAFPSQPHTPRAIDGSIRTRWSGGVQRSAADFTIELEEAGRVGQLVTDLGEFVGDYPVRLRLEVSPDGAQWETVHLGDTALHAYYAAVRHPKEVPVVYPINRDNVRFLRMTQLGWGARDWSIAEVRVLR